MEYKSSLNPKGRDARKGVKLVGFGSFQKKEQNFKGGKNIAKTFTHSIALALLCLSSLIVFQTNMKFLAFGLVVVGVWFLFKSIEEFGSLWEFGVFGLFNILVGLKVIFAYPFVGSVGFYGVQFLLLLQWVNVFVHFKSQKETKNVSFNLENEAELI